MRLRLLLRILGLVPVLLALASVGPGSSCARAQVPGGGGIIENIAVSGNQRVEPATVVSYLTIRIGDPFSPDTLDESLKRLFATGLFADVSFDRSGNTLIINVTENPIINRIIFDGNKAVKNEDISEEVQLRPRIVFTRAKVRADVQRIMELYRTKGHFAAVIEPKVVQLPQNRVDVIFEISEGEKTKIRSINFIGNTAFSDSDLKKIIATREGRWWKIFGGNDTFDPDRQAFDREQLRQHYFNNGYADFRVISAVAELTPDRKDFLITFVIEEGVTYTFGEVDIESEINEISPELFRGFLSARTGNLYSIDAITNSVDSLTNAAGVLGFAFVNIRPLPRRNRETRTLDVTFRILDAPRVYVEKIDIHGNVRTRDQVIRREFRLVEGDAFNLSRMERSRARIQRLGFFREVGVEQLPGSLPDRLVLDVNVEEEATGELSLGAAFSSTENFIFQFSIRQRNLLGRGQDLRLNLSLSSLRKQVDVGFTEPRFLGRNISAGIDLFAIQSEVDRNSTFDTTALGGSLRLGLPIGERSVLALRYTLRRDKLDTSINTRSRFIIDAVGTETTSLVGFSLIYDSLDNPQKPTRGQRAVFNQDFAGLGGTVFYLRNTVEYNRFFPLPFGFRGRVGGEAGLIKGLGEEIRINDRFFLGGPRVRGFDVAGIGPVVVFVDENGEPLFTGNNNRNDFIGGETFYTAKFEIFLPLGEAARELGVEASLFADAGALFELGDEQEFPGERIFGDSARPRLALGVGVGWDSPFGPFRIDIAKIFNESRFDDTQSFGFNVGTSF